MGAIATIVVISIIVMGFAGWMYLKSKPKRIGYSARIWKKQGEGKKKQVRFFAKDFLIMRKPAHGIVEWKLEKGGLMLATEPSAEDIQIEGKEKIIDLIHDKGKLSILKRNYIEGDDALSYGSMDFDKHAYCELKRAYEIGRLKTNKNPLEFITKWIVVALTMFGLIAISYVQAEGWVNSSENIKIASENYLLGADRMENATINLARILGSAGRESNYLSENQVEVNSHTNTVETFG